MSTTVAVSLNPQCRGAGRLSSRLLTHTPEFYFYFCFDSSHADGYEACQCHFGEDVKMSEERW